MLNSESEYKTYLYCIIFGPIATYFSANPRFKKALEIKFSKRLENKKLFEPPNYRNQDHDELNPLYLDSPAYKARTVAEAFNNKLYERKKLRADAIIDNIIAKISEASNCGKLYDAIELRYNWFDFNNDLKVNFSTEGYDRKHVIDSLIKDGFKIKIKENATFIDDFHISW